METALYALSFIPIILIPLVIHEAGHLLAAWMMGVRTTEFQIGIGPRIGRIRTGNLRIFLPTEKEKPTPGEIVYVWVDERDDDRGGRKAYNGMEWARPVRTRPKFKLKMPWQKPDVPEPDPNSPVGKYPVLGGMVKKADEEGFTITSHTWTLATIPLMAMVHIADDPQERMYGYFNTVPWITRMTIIFAGVGANLILLLGVLIALTLWPATAAGTNQVLKVQLVQAGGPAATAGLLEGDFIIQVNDTLMPNYQQLSHEIDQAHRDEEPVRLLVQRGKEHIAKRVTPDPQAGLIGIVSRMTRIEARDTSKVNRFMYIGGVYLSAIVQVFQPSSYGENPEESATPRFAGVVTAVHYTTQAVEIAHLKAWIAILGGVTMSMALVNILPVPPLDGSLVILHTVKSFRRGKAVNPMLEQQLAMYGMALIFSLIIYLAIRDIQRLI